MSFVPFNIPDIPHDISVVFVVGATASGKSDFALSLAEKYNGIIINSDALQIYSELSIITARPAINDMQKIPHYLYGFLNIAHSYNVADWCKDVQHLLKIHTDKKIIIVGGTGLYVKSLIHGIAKIPDIPDAIRQSVRTLPNQEIYDALKTLDPIAIEKLHINDTQRLSRAYEVVLHTGKSMYDYQKNMVSFLPPDIKTIGYFLNPPRDILYERINRRFDLMIKAGAIDEVKKIMNYDTNLTGIKAVGIPEIMAYLTGNVPLETATDKAKQSSRNYAKRQLTFFNNQFLDFIKL
jgi:tRNA dimethylallyltransferase